LRPFGFSGFSATISRTARLAEIEYFFSKIISPTLLIILIS
jgi:hypothetical protein